jgi:multidrug transporter EmrE-like cation transporter
MERPARVRAMFYGSYSGSTQFLVASVAFFALAYATSLNVRVGDRYSVWTGLD